MRLFLHRVADDKNYRIRGARKSDVTAFGRRFFFAGEKLTTKALRHEEEKRKERERVLVLPVQNPER